MLLYNATIRALGSYRLCQEPENLSEKDFATH